MLMLIQHGKHRVGKAKEANADEDVSCSKCLQFHSKMELGTLKTNGNQAPSNFTKDRMRIEHEVGR